MKWLLIVGKLFIGFFFLTVLTVLVGCTSKNLAGVNQLKTIHGNPPVIKNTTGNLVSLGVVSSISSGQSISSYLDDRGLDGYGDKDWYLLKGVTSGSTITVELTGSSTGDFDLAIWKDGSWVAYDDSSSSNARLSNTAGSTTWIWVGIWSGRGSYTLRVNGACSGGRLEASIFPELTPYIQRACYDRSVLKGAGVQLFLTTEGGNVCRTIVFLNDWCRTFASFVIYNRLWKGDRSLESITQEIYLHSLAALIIPERINPIHIEYMCKDLSDQERGAYNGC